MSVGVCSCGDVWVGSAEYESGYSKSVSNKNRRTDTCRADVVEMKKVAKQQ